MENIVLRQKNFFATNKTLDYDYRKKNLKLLRQLLITNYDKIISAFKEDFNKCEFEVVETEIGMCLHEIDFMLKNLKKLMKPRAVKLSVINFPARAKQILEPFGCCLIVSPWNYPLQLSILPLAGAIAAGNTVVLKLSDKTPNVSYVIKKMLSAFDENYIYASFNSAYERENIFNPRYDYVFYTGSTKVAKMLMEKQAKYLTPITLELGGKSPCIVDKDADLNLAAKRIAWGKFLNAGQTCVAPDYALVHKDIKEEFLKKLLEYTRKFYYDGSAPSPNLPYIVTENYAEKLESLLGKSNILIGGKRENRLFEPTILDGVTFDDEIMKEEIFGPVLPVIEFDDITEISDRLSKMEKPLALYYFGRTNEKNILKTCHFGGGCVNDTIMHVSETNLPFGGLGNSGMGSYHGQKSFETFSHSKSVLKKSNMLDINLRYPPHTKKKLALTKTFFKIK